MTEEFEPAGYVDHEMTVTSFYQCEECKMLLKSSEKIDGNDVVPLSACAETNQYLCRRCWDEIHGNVEGI